MSLIATLESELKYTIEFGQVHDINIWEGDPPLPPSYPQLACPTLRCTFVVVRWNMALYPAIEGVCPDWLRLWLFKPKEPFYSNLDTLPLPPGRDDIIRADDIGGRHPERTDSYLWQDYVVPCWQLVDGVALEQDLNDANYSSVMRPSDRVDGFDGWPGKRYMHLVRNRITDDSQVVFPTGPAGNPIPLIVATEIPTVPPGIGTTALLMLLEIKRKGRLRLFLKMIKLEVEVESIFPWSISLLLSSENS